MIGRSVVGAAALAFVSGCAGAVHTVYRSDSISIVEGDSHPFTYKSRRAGEEDLEKLVLTAKKEDSWIFVDDKSSNTGIWIDVGDEQTLTSISISLGYVSSVLGSLAHKADVAKHTLSVSNYHIHPLEAFNAAARKLADKQFVAVTLDTATLERYSMPSSADIVLHATISHLIRRHVKEGILTSDPSAVVTPWGTFYFRCSAAVLDEFDKDGKEAVKSRYNKAVQRAAGCRDIACTMKIFSEDGIIMSYARRQVDPSLKVMPKKLRVTTAKEGQYEVQSKRHESSRAR